MTCAGNLPASGYRPERRLADRVTVIVGIEPFELLIEHVEDVEPSSFPRLPRKMLDQEKRDDHVDVEASFENAEIALAWEIVCELGRVIDKNVEAVSSVADFTNHSIAFGRNGEITDHKRGIAAVLNYLRDKGDAVGFRLAGVDDDLEGARPQVARNFGSRRPAPVMSAVDVMSRSSFRGFGRPQCLRRQLR